MHTLADTDIATHLSCVVSHTNHSVTFLTTHMPVEGCRAWVLETGNWYVSLCVFMSAHRLLKTVHIK